VAVRLRARAVDDLAGQARVILDELEVLPKPAHSSRRFYRTPNIRGQTLLNPNLFPASVRDQRAKKMTLGRHGCQLIEFASLEQTGVSRNPQRDISRNPRR
jgi:hypothetical protein